jgi:hypothetical protein
MIISGVVSFSVTWFVASGEEGAIKTVVSVNFVVALVAMLVFLLVSVVLVVLHVSSVRWRFTWTPENWESTL